MSVSSLADRLARPLVWAIGAVFTLGTMSAVSVGPAQHDLDAVRAPLDPAVERGEADGTVPATPHGSVEETEGAADPPPVPPEDETPVPPPLGTASAPASGVHRYEVTTTAADGTATVQEELREIEVLSGDRTAGTVRISARLAGESQVSVLDWSPSAALVRSTRIESEAGPSRDCTWDPPFPELGRLQTGETWTVDSTCRTPVAGVDTRFTVTGEGRVVGEATVPFGGEDLRVWHVRRDRTTTIQAEVGGRTLVQTVREEGELFFDPGRGLVIRSDVTVTLGGTQTGVSRRVSVLQPA